MQTHASPESARPGLLFHCERCGQAITVAAALLFSPPVEDRVRKHHLCATCYQEIIAEFSARRPIAPA